MSSWVIEAIEQAAMSRARAQLGPLAYLAGVKVNQLLWLIADYKSRTGKDPTAIEPSWPLGGAEPS